MSLGAIAAEVARDWGVAIGAVFPSSPWSYVAEAGDDAVIKVRAAEDWESDQDTDALLRWSGDGAVRVLRHDVERRAVLLERARPGHDLASAPWEESLAAAADVARRLWVPAGSPFRSVHDFVPRWLDEVEAPGGVRDAYANLGRRADTLVHGDLHHHNLLRHGDRWLAIDSKAMRGEPEFDVAPLMWNPVGSAPSRGRVADCVRVFADLGLDPRRILAWARVRAAYLGHHDVVALLR
jgi:streptomycin 6-kinase